MPGRMNLLPGIAEIAVPYLISYRTCSSYAAGRMNHPAAGSGVSCPSFFFRTPQAAGY